MSLEAEVDVTVGGFRLVAALAVASGCILAVTGPNGAGKTTLLRALAGALPASIPAAATVGYAPTGAVLLPHLTAAGNVGLPLRARGAGRADTEREVLAALEAMGAAGFAALRPSALSAGQAQRVALARALVARPALLLLDEPFSAISVDDRADLRARIRDRLGTACAVVATHDEADVAWADRVMTLDGGRPVAVTN